MSHSRSRAFLAIAVVVVCTGGWSLYNLLAPRPILFPGCATPALWAHRGFHAVAPENSVASVRAAVAKGFCGAEIDVQWFDDRGLVVAHDEIDENDLLPNALTLAQLLDSLPQAPAYLWLDFKNLDLANASAAAAHLDSLIARHHFTHRFVVESVSSVPLRLLWWHAPDVIPAYWIKRPALLLRRGPLYDARIAAAVGLMGLPALSVPQEMLTKHLTSLFGRLAIFTWTCNSLAEIESARALGARVVLTDGDFSGLYSNTRK
ncbi:MAG TPA: glycerophosphodiester phosphodiesterase [Gemmatimonadaceae bacterium]|nr:glycerophosphodiester phosphodiesterase [Gemmatimonadaceae bacterium]